MSIDPKDLSRYLIAVDAPKGVEFTVYAADPANKIRFQQTIVWVSEYTHRGPIDSLPDQPLLVLNDDDA